MNVCKVCGNEYCTCERPVTWRDIERIEKHIADLRRDNDIAISTLNARIAALEHPHVGYHDVEEFYKDDEEEPALEHPQDAKPQGREWVNYADAIWVYWNDGEVTLTSLGILSDANMHKLIAIMPYIEGDEKPDAPSEATK